MIAGQRKMLTKIFPLTQAANVNIYDLQVPVWCEAGGGPCVEWPGEPA